MTNIERLLSLLGFEPPNNTAEGALLDLGISETDTYTAANLNPVKKAALSVMEVILTTADTGNGEVGWTAKYDRDAILKRMAIIKDELSITEVLKPTIKGIQPW